MTSTRKKNVDMLHRNKLKMYHRTKRKMQNCKCMEDNIGENLGELGYAMTS